MGLELLAQPEDAGLGPHRGGGTPFRTADGAEQDGVGGLCSGKSLVGQMGAVGVNGGLGLRLGGSRGKRTRDVRRHLHHQRGGPAG